MDIEWRVVSSPESRYLFSITRRPPVDATLKYAVNWSLLGDLSQYDPRDVIRWKLIDGQYWKVIDVYFDVQNVSEGGQLIEQETYFVRVEPIDPSD